MNTSSREIVMQRILMITVLALLLAGCGRKGKLIPPEALRPAPVHDLQIAQRGESFQVSWSQPTQDEGNRPLKELAGFHLFKREVLPPEEDCESCADAYKSLKIIDLQYLQDVRRAGGRFFINDPDVETGTRCSLFRRMAPPAMTPTRPAARRSSPPLRRCLRRFLLPPAFNCIGMEGSCRQTARS